MGLENLDAVGHETRDANPRAVLTTALGLAAMVVVVAGGVWWFQDYLTAGAPRTSPMVTDAVNPDSPRLQAAPAVDLAAYFRAERARLAGYDWVERPNLLRIPIERAIELTVERHGNLPHPPAESSEGQTP